MDNRIVNDIIIENNHVRLVIAPDCTAKSLIYKATGEELLVPEEEIALFSVSQARPHNNEVKLAHMNKYTTYQANRIHQEDGKLIVGFEEIPYEAVVSYQAADNYITFTLDRFFVGERDYADVYRSSLPAVAFRLLQLPLRHREKFGEWLNIVSDDQVSACVIAPMVETMVDSERRAKCRILYAEAKNEVRLFGTTAALMVCPSKDFMDIMDAFEQDFDLPRGVASRRDERTYQSIFRVPFLTPENADTYIACAKAGGFKNMMIYYYSMFKEEPPYTYCGDYDYLDSYPNGDEDLKAILDKIKAAGINPGFHFLHTFAGIKSRYVTPVPDHRLLLAKHFTLARPITESDTTIYVEENPATCPTSEKYRVLRFGKEMIAYERFSTEKPWRFEGCTRGFYDTTAYAQEAGLIGGLVDFATSSASAIMVDQESDLQEEIADKLAHIYNLGFTFNYFDGAEGVNQPFAYYVPKAQMKIYERLHEAPIFNEGAAKSHFSWHIISGGNAFDFFPNPVFKEKLVEFPFREAKQLQADHTRVNFGWWNYNAEVQPDMYEFGTSRAAAWNCPITVTVAKTELLTQNPRTKDNFEVLRRWEDVRAKKWLTDAQKEALRDPKQEHTLLINEQGEYELVPYDLIECGAEGVRAFCFERKGKSYVTFWHTTGKGKMQINLPADAVYEQDLGKNSVVLPAGANALEVADKCYISANVSKETLCKAFAEAVSL